VQGLLDKGGEDRGARDRLPAQDVAYPSTLADGGEKMNTLRPRDASQGHRARNAGGCTGCDAQVRSRTVAPALVRGCEASNDALTPDQAMFGGESTAMEGPAWGPRRGRPRDRGLRWARQHRRPARSSWSKWSRGVANRPVVAEHGEGMHHVRYPVEDFAGTREAMQSSRLCAASWRDKQWRCTSAT